MLHLQSESQARWLQQVDSHLDEILIDHAHCEHKAAATAMNLLGAYIEKEELTQEMTRIVEEELSTFIWCWLCFENATSPFADNVQETMGNH